MNDVLRSQSRLRRGSKPQAVNSKPSRFSFDNGSAPQRSPYLSSQPSTGKILPSLSTSDDAFSASSLLYHFTAARDSMAQFASHLNNSVKFRQQINNILSDTDHYFQNFYIHVQKLCGSAPSSVSRYSSLVSVSSALCTALKPFHEDWFKLQDIMDEAREYGSKSISESIIANFLAIKENIEFIQQCETKTSAFHDPIVRATRPLLHQCAILQKAIFGVISHPDNMIKHKQVSNDLRGFSRSLNSAFQSEFTHVSLSPTDLEKIRSLVFTSCNDIIEGERAAIMFETDISKADSDNERFHDVIQKFVDKYGVPISFIREKNSKSRSSSNDEFEIQESVENESVSFDTTMSIEELLNAASIFNDEKMSSFVSVLKEKIKTHIESIENEKATLQNDLENIQLKNAQLQAVNRNLKEMKTPVNTDNGNNEELEKCLRHIVKKLRIQLKEKSLDIAALTTQQMMENAIRMSDALEDQTCQMCHEHELIEEQCKDILVPIVGIDTGLGTISIHVKDIIEQLKMKIKNLENDIRVSNQNKNEMDASISKLMRFFDQKNDCTVDFADSIISKVEKERKSFNSQLAKSQDEIRKKLGEMFNTCSNESLEEQMRSIKEEIEDCKKYQVSLQQLARETEERLQNYLQVNQSNMPIVKSVQSLLTQLENSTTPVNDIITKMEAEKKKFIKELQEIIHRLNTSLKHDIDKTQGPRSVSSYLDELSRLIEELEEKIESAERAERKRYTKFIKDRAAIEMIDWKLQRFLGLEETELKVLELNTILKRIDDFVEQITHKSTNDGEISSNEINKMFESILRFDAFSQTNKNDPRVYIPEISANYQMLAESITALSPFAQILNNIFKQFDCKIASFNPATESFTFIRDQIYQLHNVINTVGPSKMHSLLFLVLSRFVALLSSFLSTLSSK